LFSSPVTIHPHNGANNVSFLQTRVDPEVYETQSYIDSFHDSPAIVERFPDHFVSLDDQQFACNDAFRGDTINGPAWSAACVDALACTSATLRTQYVSLPYITPAPYRFVVA